MTDAEKAAAEAAKKAEDEKTKGEMPQWAKDLKTQVEALSGGGDPSGVQKIPPTTPAQTEAEKEAAAKAAASATSTSSKKKGFLDWLM